MFCSGTPSAPQLFLFSLWGLRHFPSANLSVFPNVPWTSQPGHYPSIPNSTNPGVHLINLASFPDDNHTSIILVSLVCALFILLPPPSPYSPSIALWKSYLLVLRASGTQILWSAVLGRADVTCCLHSWAFLLTGLPAASLSHLHLSLHTITKFTVLMMLIKIIN